MSTEYNGKIDQSKWLIWGASGGGCIPSPEGDSQRCVSQAKVAGGHLTITGTADKTSGVNSKKSLSEPYAIEAREKSVAVNHSGVPHDQVMLAFPTQPGSSGNNGEVDYAEGDPGSKLTMFAHYGSDQKTQHSCQYPKPSNQWHTYAVKVTHDTITAFFDGQKVCTVPNDSNHSPVSVGGGQLDDLTNGSNETDKLMVDYVHAYQLGGAKSSSGSS